MEQEYATVESWKLEAQKATISDLLFAADWLGAYETDDQETAQQLTNAINFLVQHIGSKQRRTAINNKKREYAQQNGIKFSQVKVQRKAK